MILGIYWYFGFPEGLYHFSHFTFRKGLGGHVDNPAELTAMLETDSPERIIEKLNTMVQEHTEGYLFVSQSHQTLKIGTASHHLFDYDFELILKVEKMLLAEEGVKFIEPLSMNNPHRIRLFHEQKRTARPTYPKQTFVMMVSSGQLKNNAEHAALRVDCNLPEEQASAFINKLHQIATKSGIHSFYYKYSVLKGNKNLMLFFTNGRQGVDLQPKQQVDIAYFESAVLHVKEEYDVSWGHVGGFDHYPKSGPVIVEITDEEFLLDEHK